MRPTKLAQRLEFSIGGRTWCGLASSERRVNKPSRFSYSGYPCSRPWSSEGPLVENSVWGESNEKEVNKTRINEMVAFLTVSEGDQNRNLLGFLLLYPIFTLRSVCHGEALVKLWSASHKCNFPDNSQPWCSQDIQFLKTYKLFPQDNILGLSYW